jgi:hypothetical protein
MNIVRIVNILNNVIQRIFPLYSFIVYIFLIRRKGDFDVDVLVLFYFDDIFSLMICSKFLLE